MTTGCFHCGQPLPIGTPRQVVIQGQLQPVCCAGCEMAAQWIQSAGLGAYYRWRTEPATAPDEATDHALFLAYDRPQAQQSFVTALPDGHREAELLVENLNCAACAWLIEGALGGQPGVDRIQVNAANGRLLLRFDPARVRLSDLLARLASLGFPPHPQRPGQAGALHLRERRQALKRLALSGLGMMQAMTYALSLYGGAFHGMDPVYADFLRLVSLLITTPVVLYAGWPFFESAVQGLRARRIVMDVPVAVAIGVAYAASVRNTLVGNGPVYFDTVCMFIFFLTLARYLQASARARASESGDALARLLPDTCLRETAQGLETITLQELLPGDRVRVPPGAALPADGRVLDQAVWMDESLLTGESRPVRRLPGDRVIAGSVNGEQALRLEVTACNADSTISHIGRLLRKAQSERPPTAAQADRLAAWFAPAVLLA
ncbi:MAG: heavy metal translocating P-type ATPase metal-binding domain-containing protein, partial [Candidatus Macondimonas sp.]